MKKLVKLIIFGILLLAMMTFVYANENTNQEKTYETKDFVTINQPKINEDGKVKVTKDLFITLDLKDSDSNIYLTLKKRVPVMDDFIIEKIINEKVKKASVVNNLVEYIVDIKTDDSSEDISDENISEIKNTINDYIDYNIEFKKFEKTFLEKKQKDISLVENKEDHLNEIELLKEEYELKKEKLNEFQKTYQDLFKKTILNKVLVENVGVIPYFEKTIEDIEPGYYEMNLEIRKNKEDQETLVLMENKEFQIVKKDNNDEEKSDILKDLIKFESVEE
ncbi:MAG: hypothetical protein ACQEQE_09065 [Bacillota bacterium]